MEPLWSQKQSESLPLKAPGSLAQRIPSVTAKSCWSVLICSLELYCFFKNLSLGLKLHISGVQIVG